jgi:glycerol dehydrogenase
VAFGVLVQLMLEGKPRSLVDQVLGFSAEVGLPMTLAEVGLGEMTSEMLQQIATRSTAKGETIHNEPFEVRPELVSDAIRAADATGRAWRQKNGLAAAVRA